MGTLSTDPPEGLRLHPPVAAGSRGLAKESEAHKTQQVHGFSFFCCFDILGKLVLNLICPDLSRAKGKFRILDCLNSVNHLQWEMSNLFSLFRLTEACVALLASENKGILW